MYVKFNRNGDIESFADFEYPDSVKVNYNVVRGYDGKLYKEGEEPEKSDEELYAETAAAVRVERDRLLNETDYLVMPDYPLSEERREVVLSYRQALRDVPLQAGFPYVIEWPELL